MLRCAVLGTALFAVSSVVGEVSAAEGASPAAQRVFRVGAAKVDFTPPEGEGIKLHGYDQRTEPFKGIHDRVHFRAIVLDDGQQQAAIVSADVALVVEKFWRMATEKIESELKIPRQNVMIAATHTHSSPDGKYRDREPVINKAVAAVKLAQAALKPARFGVGVGQCNVNVNRIARCAAGTERTGWWLGVNPDGPADKTLHVVKFEDLEGRPIALVVNYCAHGTTMGKESLALSADHPGACSRYLEKHYGNDCVALWTSGAAGDVDPIYAYRPDFGGRMDPVETMGFLQGKEAVRVADEIKTASPSALKCQQKVVEAPGRKNRSGLPFRPEGDYEIVDGKPMPIRLSVVAIDRVAFCGVSGEVFNVIGQRLKERLAPREAIVITHANGSSGYLPSDEAYGRLGYEVLIAQVKQGVEKLILEELVGMVERLR